MSTMQVIPVTRQGAEGQEPTSANMEGRYFVFKATALAAGATISVDVSGLLGWYMDFGPNTAGDLSLQIDDCNPFFFVRLGMFMRLHWPARRLTFRNDSGGPINFSVVWSGNPNFYIFQGAN